MTDLNSLGKAMANAGPLRKKITLTTVRALTNDATLWDTEITGFCARRQKSASITYQLKTRVNGKIRWFTIGRHGQPWTPDSARKQAIQLLADPSRGDKPKTSNALTVAEVAERFFNGAGRKLKPRTLDGYQRLNKLYLKPAFGSQPIATLTRAEVSKKHASWSQHPRAANHALALLSRLMTWAEDQGHRDEGTNPVRRIERYEEQRRERFLTTEELTDLGTALRKAEDEDIVQPYAIAAIRLLILTGARLNEILTLQWDHVDVSRRMIFLDDSKTGKKPLSLNDAAIDVLKGIPRIHKNPYVIIGKSECAHLVNLQKPWRRLRSLAGLEGLRIHDLRHTFASVAVASGGSLAVLGRQLGHNNTSTTQRYAHLGDDPVRDLTQKTGQVLADAMNKIR